MTTFSDYLRDKGFLLSKPLLPGDTITRFAHKDKPRSESGWARLFPEGDAGVWGDWRESEKSHYWRLDGRSYKQLTKIERQTVKERAGNARAERAMEDARKAQLNRAAWDAILHHPAAMCVYLEKKKVGNYGLKINVKGEALLPMRDTDGVLHNYQNISTEPKLYQPGRVAGYFHLIEGDKSQVIVTSGYATGASIHEATGLAVIVCGGDSNILRVATLLREAKWEGLVLAVDNDTGGSLSGNKIAKKAEELKFKTVMPDMAGDFNDIRNAGIDIYPYFFKVTPAFSYRQILADKSPMPEDIVAPRILTEGGMLVFGGAPKVGKSDFVLAWLLHMAAGLEFMGMIPPRPLKVFYLQAEVQYHYMRERMNNVDIPKEHQETVNHNFYVTPQVRMLLDESGVKVVGNTIRQHFRDEKPDIICLDPITNLYDQESENDNAQMMKFLSQRVESLRAYAKESTAFLLVHHTKKISVEELAKDPFQMFAGASSLRRYYTTGMLMYRPDETVSECILTYEVRNGPRVPNINVDKDKMTLQWKVIPKEESRIGRSDIEDSAQKERERKIDIIKQELRFESQRGIPHTVSSLSFALAGKSGLGSSATITRLLKELFAQGDLQPMSVEGKIETYINSPI